MDKKFTSFSLLSLLCLAALSHGQSGSISQTTPEFVYPELRQVLKKAEEYSLQYEQLDTNLLQAQNNKRIRMADKLPTVNFSTGIGAYWSNYEDSSGNTEGTQFGVNDLSLSAGYTLYNWGAKQANHRIAEKSYENFLLNYNQQMAGIGRSLRIQFMDLIMDKFSLKTLELETAITQGNIDEDTIRFEQGRLSSENYERSMNSRKKRLLDLENLRRHIDRKIADFNLGIGFDNALTLDDIPTHVPAISNVNEQLFALARKTKSKNYSDIPSVQIAQLGLDIADENVTSTQSINKPRLGLSAGVSIDVEPTSGNQRVLASRAGLGLSWNIFSNGANKRRILNSMSSRTLKIAQYRQMLKQTEIDLQRLVEDLSYKYSKLEIAESEYQLALQSYEKSKDEYERGRVSEQRFLNVELGRLYQEKGIYQQRKDYMIAVTDFLKTIGQDPVLSILTPPGEKDLSHLTENR